MEEQRCEVRSRWSGAAYLPVLVTLLAAIAANALVTSCASEHATTATDSSGPAQSSRSFPGQAAPGDLGEPSPAQGAPGAGTIVFVKGAVDSEGLPRGEGIYLVRDDGSYLTALVRSRWAHDPAWSPDGRRIAYIEHRTVHVMRADGSVVRHVRSTVDGDGAGSVAWSPDGKRIAFVSEGWVNRLYVAPAAHPGGARYLIGGFDPEPVQAAWGPHGRLFFLDERSGRRPRICLVHPDGTGFRVLRTVPVFSSFTLTPDGDWLLVWDSAGDRLVLTPASGADANVRLVLDGVTDRTGMSQTDALSSSMASDGRIVFAADRSSHEFPSALYVLGAGHERLRQVRGAGLGWDPVWRPE